MAKQNINNLNPVEINRILQPYGYKVTMVNKNGKNVIITCTPLQ